MQGSADDKQQAALELLEVMEAVRIVAVLLSPITPGLARLVYQQLGYSDADFEAVSWADAQWGGEQAPTCYCTVMCGLAHAPSPCRV